MVAYVPNGTQEKAIMGTEVMAVPEEYLEDVIKVIRAGLEHTPDVRQEAREGLELWCVMMSREENKDD